MADDKVDFEATSSGGKVSVSGPNATKITNQLGDLLSPFTELAGLAGDHLRIYRFESVTKRLQRAREIAKERGNPLNHVHPKNLIPWLENASLEDDENSEISELWSRLLLSADSKFDSRLAILTDALKRLGAKEAKVLKEICLASPEFPEIGDQAAEAFMASRGLRHFLASLEKCKNQEDFKFALDAYGNYFATFYILPILIDSDFNDKESVVTYNPQPITGPAQDASAALENEGLITTGYIEERIGDRLMSLIYLKVTPLGVELISRCHPKTAGEAATK